MQIWVDADACPKAIKDILYRVAERTGITTTLVANQFLPTPPSCYIKFLQVDTVSRRLMQAKNEDQKVYRI
jgi:uncharacterized protein YaiI (UPF0178 family)